MSKLAEFTAPGRHPGHIKSPTLTGQAGDPSAWPSTHHSRTTSTVLSGFYDEECDDELFDCYDEEEEEEVKESLIREFVRCILLEGVTLSMEPPHTPPKYPGPTKKAEADEDEDIIDEDELEEEDEVEEVSSGAVPGAATPMGTGPDGKAGRSAQQARQRAIDAAWKSFGGRSSKP